MKKETEYYGRVAATIQNQSYIFAEAKEVEENEARVQKMRDDGCDEYDIKKQVEPYISRFAHVTY